MAPELIGDASGQDEPTADPDPFIAVITKASDVYAFGMVVLEVSSGFYALRRITRLTFFQLLTDQAPWYGYQAQNVIFRVALGKRPNRGRYRPLQDTQWEFLQECWAATPADRPTMIKIGPRLMSWNGPGQA